MKYEKTLQERIDDFNVSYMKFKISLVELFHEVKRLRSYNEILAENEQLRQLLYAERVHNRVGRK